MPKKTRREKILSDRRKSLNSGGKLQTFTFAPLIRAGKPATTTAGETMTALVDIDLLKRDLLKTALFTLAAFLFEYTAYHYIIAKNLIR